MFSINTQIISIPERIFKGWQQTIKLIADVIGIQAELQIEHVSTESMLSFYKKNSHNCELNCQCSIKAYFSLPLTWPNQQAFGTLFVLDHQAQQFSEKSKLMLTYFQQSVQTDLESLYQTAELLQRNRQLKQGLVEKDVALKLTQQALQHEQDNRTELEVTLNYQQHFDHLTGIENQLSLVNELNNMLVNADEGNKVAVIYLGLRNFKSINHSYGYCIGDQVLLEISHRIRQHLIAGSLVARCWGDSFAIVIQGDNIIELTIDLIDRLSHSFEQLFTIDGYSIVVQVCIGIALAADYTEQAISLIEKAEAAMTISKEQGSSYNFFDQEVEAVIGERHQLESHLSEALSNNEMTLHYQPITCIKNAQVLGAEALIRWNNPTLGSVAPDRFIHLAEQNGQILAIGNFVLHTAIKQAASWQQQFGHGFLIAVNMSPMQFSDIRLVAYIEQLLTRYKLPPTCLELEITEGVMLQDEQKVGRVIKDLQQLGIRISLDDFGTGYASLSYLQKYSFDSLKIDRSFISNLMECEQDKELARAIIAIAKNLNLSVIAEGVETAAQHQFILAEGCNFGQGYLYGKPVPATLFPSVVNNLANTFP